MPNERLSFRVEDAELLYKNFSGAERLPFNREGDRNFCVILDPGMATEMEKDGWNIKTTKEREEGEPGRPFIQVKVGYKIRPPKIVVITDSGRTNYDEAMVGSLDWADVRQCDLIAVSSPYDFGGKSGISAYLKTMFITIDEDYLEAKYAIRGSHGDE